MSDRQMSGGARRRVNGVRMPGMPGSLGYAPVAEGGPEVVRVPGCPACGEPASRVEDEGTEVARCYCEGCRVEWWG